MVDTYTITYTDGTTTTFTVTNGAQGVQGIQGEKGEDGQTPVITIQNGNWFINSQDTNVKAEGVKGETGNGISSIEKTSTEGLVDTYTITYTDGTTTTFTVTNGAQGVQGIQGEKGEDGQTPVITIQNGNWFINDQDTNVKAEGVKGEKGETGEQGEKGDTGEKGETGADGVTPHIGENGNWWIGTTDTGVSAKGEQGDVGADGVTPHIGEDGYWYIGETKTDVMAQGPQGEQGLQGEQGPQGVGIDYVYIKDNHLWVVLTNGDELDAGQVIFPSEIYIEAPEDDDTYTLDNDSLNGVEYIVLEGDWSEKTLSIEYSRRANIEIESDSGVNNIIVDAPRAEITLNGITINTLEVKAVAENTLTLTNSTVSDLTVEKGHVNVADNSAVENLSLTPSEKGAATKLTVSSGSATVSSVTVNTLAEAESPKIVVEENAKIETIVANNNQNDISISGDGEIASLEVTSAENHIVVPNATESNLTISVKSGVGATVAVVDEARKAILDIIESPGNDYDFIQYENEFLETVKNPGATIALGDTDVNDGVPITQSETIELLDNQYIYLNGCDITVESGPVFRVMGQNVVIAGTGSIVGNDGAPTIEIAEDASLSLNGGIIYANGANAAITTSGTLEIIAGTLFTEYVDSEEDKSYIAMSINEGSDGTIRLFGGSFYGQDPTEYLASEDFSVSTVSHEQSNYVTTYTVCPNTAHVTSAEEFIDAVNMNVVGMQIYVDEDLYFDDSVTIKHTTYISLKANIYFSQGGFIVDGSETQAVNVEVQFLGSKVTVQAGPNSPVIHVIGTDTSVITRMGWTTYTGTPVEGEVEVAEPLLKATAGGKINIWSGHFDNTYNRVAGGWWGYADENSDIVFAAANIGGTANVFSYAAEHNPIYTRHTTDKAFVEEQIYQDEDGNDVYKFFVSTTDAWYDSGYIGAGESENTTNLYIKGSFYINKMIENPSDPSDVYCLDLNNVDNFYALGEYAFIIEDFEDEGIELFIDGTGTLDAKNGAIFMRNGRLAVGGPVTIHARGEDETEERGYCILSTEQNAQVHMYVNEEQYGSEGNIHLIKNGTGTAINVGESNVCFDSHVILESDGEAFGVSGSAPVFNEEDGRWSSGTFLEFSGTTVTANIANTDNDYAKLFGAGNGAQINFYGNDNVFENKNGSMVLWANGVNIYIGGGTFKGNGEYDDQVLCDVCDHGEDDAYCFNVEGGSFYKQDPTQFIPDYCEVTQNEDGYYVVTVIEATE